MELIWKFILCINLFAGPWRCAARAGGRSSRPANIPGNTLRAAGGSRAPWDQGRSRCRGARIDRSKSEWAVEKSRVDREKIRYGGGPVGIIRPPTTRPLPYSPHAFFSPVNFSIPPPPAPQPAACPGAPTPTTRGGLGQPVGLDWRPDAGDPPAAALGIAHPSLGPDGPLDADDPGRA